jgi:MinD-like ATPase involved in chromosome partitioning or flagellar assembly
MGHNDFGVTGSAEHDDEYPATGGPPAPGSGMFPKLAPRTFPDDDGSPVPVMEQLPPPAYSQPPDLQAHGVRMIVAPLSAPPMLPPDFDEGGPVVAESSDVLTAEWLLHGRRAQPGPGWRRTVYRATGGLVRVGESAANLRRRDLVNRVRTPVAGGHHRVAVMSLKGGVGKTTTAVGLGAMLASLRGDRVIAMDANPDRGTLSDKVRLETADTVRDLLTERAEIRRYADVRQFTSQASSRLEILASDRDPAVSIEFNADDYREVSRVLEHFYSIAITDCGTGLLHSAMSGILELADHIVLVSSPSVDGARSASATLDWLEAHHYSDLVRSAVVVLSTIRPRSRSTVDLDRLQAHFAARCRDVVRVPYDTHLEEGAEVELDLLSAATRDAYLSLAAAVADGFAVPRRAQPR